MLPKVRNLIDQIQEELKADVSHDWYPDIMPLSSETLMEIVKDFGFDQPSYFRMLNWSDDFSENARHIAADTFREIRELYASNKRVFTIDKNTVTIETGTDTASKRRIDSWQRYCLERS